MRKRFIIGGVVLCIAVGYLLYTVLSGSLTYYVTVTELMEQGDAAYEERVRVSGMVTGSSVDLDTAENTLRFTITDDTASLPVLYEGLVPHTFAENKDIVIEGKYNPDGIFHASSLVMKCASKYDPED